MNFAQVSSVQCATIDYIMSGSIWGLKYCASDICKAHRYKDQDRVGCHNIFWKTRPGFPDVMRCGQPAWDESPGMHGLRSMY